MLYGGDANIAIHQGGGQGCVANIFCFGGNFYHGIKVCTTKDDTAVRFSGMQS